MAAPSPEELHELANQLERLGGKIRYALARIRGDEDRHLRRLGYRLPEVVGWAEEAERALRKTAEDIERVLSIPEDACRMPWGVCPDCGPTLVSSGGVTSCQQCGRSWPYERAETLCPEPVAFEAVDTQGRTIRICAGHAIGARQMLETITVVRPIQEQEEGQMALFTPDP